MANRKAISTKTVVYAGLMGALYYVFVVGLAPISYDVFQFRIANVLKALAIYHPGLSLGYAIGNFFANQLSPFGMLDWLVMPVFDVIAGLTAWALRKCPAPVWIGAQSIIIAGAVAVFPLGLGGNIPMLPSFLSVLASTLVVITAGHLLFKPFHDRLAQL